MIERLRKQMPVMTFWNYMDIFATIYVHGYMLYLIATQQPFVLRRFVLYIVFIISLYLADNVFDAMNAGIERVFTVLASTFAGGLAVAQVFPSGHGYWIFLIFYLWVSEHCNIFVFWAMLAGLAFEMLIK